MSRPRASIVIVCVVGLVGAAFVARSVSRVEHAEQRWTHSDLDAVPAPETNGWTRFGEIDRVPPLPVELSDWVVALERFDASSVEENEPRERAVAAFLQQPEVAEVLRQWHVVTEHPRFVDGCPLNLESFCPNLHIYQVHQLAAIEVLHHVLREDWSAAVEATDRMLEVSAGYAASARTLLGALTSISSYALALALADFVERSCPRGEDVPWYARDLLDTLARQGPLESTLRSAIIGEYLFFVGVLNLVADGETDLSGEGMPLPGWLFDRDRTLHRINAVFDDYMACAMRRETSVRPNEGARSSPLADRVFNPVGERLVETVVPPMVFENCDRHHEKLAETRKRRAELIDRFTSRSH